MYIQNKISTNAPGLYDITKEVKNAVEQSGITEGACAVFSKIGTSGVLVTSFWDTKGHEDIMDDLERVFPPRTNYASRAEPKMAAASSAAALSGRPLDFIIHEKNLLLGSSQGIYLMDTVGGREIEYGIKCL